MPKPALPTLIKLAEQAVEAAQHHLAAAQRAVAANLAAQTALTHGLQQAFTAVQQADDVTQLLHFTAFRTAEEARLATLQAQATQLQAEETAARATLQQAYLAQKRYETLHERQRLAAAKTRQTNQQNQLDDLTTTRFK